MVTIFPVLDTPVGTVAEKAPPSTLYSQTVMVVLVAVPVTVAVAGVVVPPPDGDAKT
jgi:hypothetical protein